MSSRGFYSFVLLGAGLMALELQSAQMHLCPVHYPLQDSLECLGSYKQIFCEEARSQSMKPEEAIDQTLCYTAPLC